MINWNVGSAAQISATQPFLQAPDVTLQSGSFEHNVLKHYEAEL